MPLVELQVLPLGTCGPSVSEYVAEAVNVIREKGYEFRVTPMATVIKMDSLEKLGSLIHAIEERLRQKGVKRIVFVIRIDDRFDKDLDMDKKIESVMKRLEKE